MTVAVPFYTGPLLNVRRLRAAAPGDCRFQMSSVVRGSGGFRNPVPRHAGQWPVPLHFWQSLAAELRWMFWPVPKQSAHLPEPGGSQDGQEYLPVMVSG